MKTESGNLLIMEEDINKLKETIKDLEDRIRTLEGKRIMQMDIMNGAVKSRHISEGVKYIQAGLASKLPSADIPMQGICIYYEVDTKKLKVYNYSTKVWNEVGLT